MYRNKKYRTNSKGTSTSKTTPQTSDKENSDELNQNASKRSNSTGLQRIGEDSPMKIPKVDTRPFKAPEDVDSLFSQESIPASQEPTQRYLSQRSTLYRTQSKSKTMQKAPNSYFELVLMQAGADLDQDTYILDCDHVSFVHRIRKFLEKHPDYPANTSTFKTGFEEAFNDEKLRLKLLYGCSIRIEGQEAVYQSQDSMIVNFLMIDLLQKDIIEVLMEKIELFAKNSSISHVDVPMLPLMFAQLKYVTSQHDDYLYNKTIDIYKVATVSAKADIISNAEFVLNPNKHDGFVKFLIETTSSDKELFNSLTIQTFTNLSLGPKIQKRLRRKIMTYIQNGSPITLLPTLVKFLLKAIRDDEDDTKELVTDLRRSLIFDKTDESTEKYQLEAFGHISRSLTISKTFFDVWLKTIQSAPSGDFTALDFMILIMMTSIREEKSYYIENIIRRRIKLEQITVSVLNEARSNLKPILDQETCNLLQILHDFLKEKNHFISSFAKNAYKILFAVSQSSQKKILINLVKLTCDKSANDITTTALEVLKDLNKEFAKEIQHWGMLLMPMLDRIHEMDLEQSRFVMELLCAIAYPIPPLPDCPVLQDQLDMLVKKQIINRLAAIKKQGIVGTVQLINNIARTEESIEKKIYDLDETYNSAENLPDGRPKLAAKYLNRIYSSTVYCPESLALFYEELATVLSPGNREQKYRIDRHFLNWLCEMVTFSFQDHFILESSLDDGESVKLSYQKCINTMDDCTESEIPQIAIKIAPLVLRPSAEAHLSITVLTPLFNLVRILHSIRSDGSLELINAVLGCALVLPVCFETDDKFDIFEEHDESTSKKIMDTYFHYANWLRIVISAFAGQNETKLRKKVLLRLGELIEVENTIQQLLIKAPSDYEPPICQFVTSKDHRSKTKKTGRGRKPATKTTNNAESENMSLLGTVNPAQTTVASVRIPHAKSKPTVASGRDKFEYTSGPRDFYRQMDPDIMLILCEEFVVEFPLPEDRTGSCIDILQFKFIIYDLVSKLESISGVKKFATDQHTQFISCPTDFINDIVHQFLGKIVKNFYQLSNAISDSLESVNRVLGNADLFTDKFNHLKVCFGLCLRFFGALLSWSGFDEEQNEKLLQTTLVALCNNEKETPNIIKNSTSELFRDTFDKFISIETNVVDLKSAVHVFHLISSLRKLSHTPAMEKKTRDVCKTFLCRKWYSFEGTMEKGSLANLYLNELLTGFLRNSDLKRINDILLIVSEEVKLLKKKDNVLRSFPNFHKFNFPMLFRSLCESLIYAISDNIISAEKLQTIKLWERACENLNLLLDIVKSLDVPRNFSLFLKYANIFVKVFIQKGLPVLEASLRRDPERVNDLLKTLQITTRFLHSLCCHSKAIRNTAIVSQIPFLRETIENLVFRVKAALAANKCASVFWMGNLKNKDLHGDAILSQVNSLPPSNTGSDDEDDIPDDVSIDETVLDEEVNVPSKRRTLRSNVELESIS